MSDFLAELPARIRNAKKAVTGFVTAVVVPVLAIVAGFNPALAAGVTAVLVAVGVYRAKNGPKPDAE